MKPPSLWQLTACAADCLGAAVPPFRHSALRSSTRWSCIHHTRQSVPVVRVSVLTRSHLPPSVRDPECSLGCSVAAGTDVTADTGRVQPDAHNPTSARLRCVAEPTPPRLERNRASGAHGYRRLSGGWRRVALRRSARRLLLRRFRGAADSQVPAKPRFISPLKRRQCRTGHTHDIQLRCPADCSSGCATRPCPHCVTNGK